MKKLLSKALGIAMSAAIFMMSFDGTFSGKNVVKALPSDSVFTNFITRDGTRLMDGLNELKFISLNYPQATSDNEWEHANAMKTVWCPCHYCRCCNCRRSRIDSVSEKRNQYFEAYC